MFVRTSYLLLILLVISLSAGVLDKVRVGSNYVSLSASDIFSGLICLNFLISFVVSKSKPKLPVVYRRLVYFLFLSLFSLILSLRLFLQNEVIIGGLYLVRLISYGALIPVVYNLSRQQKKLLIYLLGVVGLSVAVLGLAQYILYPDLRNLYYLGFDPHYKRAFGTFLDPGYLGIFLVLTLTVWFKLSDDFHQKMNSLWKFILMMIGGFIFLVLALTYSRASFLALVFAFFLWSLFKRNGKIFVAVLILIFLSVILLPRPGGEGVRLERTTSGIARLDSWSKATQILRDSPLLGVGFDNYRFAQKQAGYLTTDELLNSHAASGTDNSFLFVAATTGILGLGLYLFFLERVWRKGSLLLKSSLGAIVVHAFFLNSLFFPPLLVWLFILIGAETKDYS